MSSLRLIGLSGPPRSGKDSIGYALADILREKTSSPVEVHALSQPMRLAVYGYLGLFYSDEHYEANKDRPIQLSSGKTTTIRHEMISLSEHHVKPRLGHGWWGRALLNRVQITEGIIIVTDMGFHAEHDVFTETLDCAWVHVHREGKTFEGDSRKYIGRGTQLYNDTTIDEAAHRLYGRLVNQLGWVL